MKAWWRHWKWVVVVSGTLTVVGVLLTSLYLRRWMESWAPYSRSASLEVGGAVVGGAVVAGSFIWAEQLLQNHRDPTQRELQEQASRCQTALEEQRLSAQYQLTLGLAETLDGRPFQV